MTWPGIVLFENGVMNDCGGHLKKSGGQKPASKPHSIETRSAISRYFEISAYNFAARSLSMRCRIRYCSSARFLSRRSRYVSPKL